LSAVLLFKQRYPEIVTTYHRLKSEIGAKLLGLYFPQGDIPPHLQGIGNVEIKRMLASTDLDTRAAALQVLAKKGRDNEFLPVLIKLLNNRDPIFLGPERRATTLSALSQEALTAILKRGIAAEPSNILLLRPYLEAAKDGRAEERKAIAEILGIVREPLAVPLLTEIAGREDDRQLRSAAELALQRIADPARGGVCAEVRAAQMQVMAGAVLGALPLVFVAARFTLRRTYFGWALLSLAPIFLVGGMVTLIYLEFTRENYSDNAVQAALLKRDLMTLRAMSYCESSDFPADSVLARHLVRMGDPTVIKTLIQLPSLEPDDFEHWRNALLTRNRWVMARIVASRLSAGSIAQLTSSNDPEIRKALAATLGRLMVKSNEIVRTLEQLTRDDNEEVATEAASGLEKVNNYPVWWYR